ncbi:MAG: hypothetical protein A3K19_21810 [Lentisphaerae bacterium RIFOXYB12_FULL_65_16]|nr:MAG: hypothetical protein A3K18_04440 [Lentisphaerae bacterium RIFOXYA12_64_32]OGV93894.1 MAG: hypothetical protein A3K19_21810 [Lentisphaerae bacterium RIFOXYB12_FULL_65_16]
MKVIAILGSPRREGNSTILARAVLEEVAARGASVQEFSLGQLTYKGCVACEACKSASEICVLKDDLTPVLKAMAEADAVVFASPIYCADVSGQFKCFFDRTYSFFAPDFKSRLKPGKKAVLILTQGDPAVEDFADVAQRYGSALTKWLRFAENHVIRGLGLNEQGAVRKRSDLMKQAREVGAKLG